MSKEIEEKLSKIPLVRNLVALLTKIKLPGFEGLSFYDLVEMYVLGIVRGALSTRASAIAFSLFMALFPLLIFILTLVPFIIPYVQIGSQDFEQQLFFFMESFLPQATGDYFSEIFSQINQNKQSGLLSTSFFVSIFLVANGVNAIFGGFENSYHTQLNRNFFKQYFFALWVGLMLSLLFILGAIGFVYFEFYILDTITDFTLRNKYASALDQKLEFISWLKTAFFAALFYLITAILYYFGTAETKKMTFFSLGALVTTILFLLSSYFFGVYIDHFSTYNQLYGALGGLLILMVYIWINANVLLLGFELNMSLLSLKQSVFIKKE
jgi:membrane protein